jgi:molecular chaperone HtpG
MNTEPDKSEQVDLDSAQEERLIDIDFTSLISLLSHHLYREDSSPVIRELLSNANDSLITRKREFGFEQGGPEIRIWLDAEAAQLVVKDNGIGMTKNDLISYLSCIGASLTREKSKENESIEQSFESLIGRFGVGFLSSFIVADKIVVSTRKHGHPGYRWSSQGGRNYKIEQCDNLDEGTSVVLELKPRLRLDWTEEKIKLLVLENARYFVFPIFWGPQGTEKLNDFQAPWYGDTPPTERELDSYRDFLARYRDEFASAESAVEVIPLYSKDIRGALYIPPFSAMPQGRIGVVDIFCKRVFVAKDHPDIVSEEFRFIKGVVDCYDFHLNAARDDIQRDSHVYLRVKEFISRQLLERFTSLARQAGPGPGSEQRTEPGNELARLRLQTVMNHLHIWLKNALVGHTAEGQYQWEDEYLIALEDFMPFRSSIGGFTTVPEYLKRQVDIGKERRIVFLPRHNDNSASILQMALQRKQEVLFPEPELPIDEEYLRRYAKVLGVPCESTDDAISNDLPKLPVEEGWHSIVNYFQLQLNHPEFSLSVYLSEFEPDTIPGRILADTKSEGLRRFEEIVEELEHSQTFSKDDSLFQQIALMKQKRPHSLYLNKHHPSLSRLADYLQSGRHLNLDPILHPMFHDISLACGHQVHAGHLAEYQTRMYTEVIEHAFAKSQLETLTNQLTEAKRKSQEIQEQNNALNRELASVREASPHAQGTLEQVFFIRPMKDGFDDTISRRVVSICKGLNLSFVDPKSLKGPGEIFSQVIRYLKSSRFVIADVTETNNANVYYEAGFTEGTFPQKLILIVNKKVLDSRQLPFNFLTQRVLSYDTDVDAFDEFLAELQRTLEEMMAKQTSN